MIGLSCLVLLFIMLFLILEAAHIQDGGRRGFSVRNELVLTYCPQFGVAPPSHPARRDLLASVIAVPLSLAVAVYLAELATRGQEITPIVKSSPPSSVDRVFGMVVGRRFTGALT